MVLEQTKQILKNHEGHEYCGNSVSYHVFLSPDAYEHPFKPFDEFEKSQQENSNPENDKTVR